jgi:hypothetical protein
MPISGNPGAIPDIDEYQPEQAAPPQQQAPQGEAASFRDVAPRAAPAIQQAIQGVARMFGGGQPQQGIPDEESAVQASDGPRRFASGAGAATNEEVRDIDFAGGIDMVQADEGVKQLMRVDKVVNFYLERGQKDMAEAAGVSLLLRGATQVKQAGTLAAAALSEYQQTGDPNDLKAASQAIQRAHQLIPDGFDLQLDVDPRTRQLVATTIDSEGKSSREVVDPRAVPQLLQGAMDGSAYWKAVYQLAQPSLAKEGMQNEAAAAQKASDRAYTEGYDQYKYERERGDKLSDEDRKAERWLWEQQYQEEAGRTAGERLDAEQEQYFADWNDRLAAAPPEQKQQVFNEGLQYRFDNAKDRQQPVAQEELMFSPDSQYAEVFDQEDVLAMTNIARIIAQKNATLDGSGAMEMAAALVMSPKGQVKNRPDGTLDINGFNLIFNPQLLPMLNGLRQKHGMAR